MGSTENLSVLMVCLGNICRSPMAEAVFRHVAKEQNLLDRFSLIDSAGTASYHAGSEPDPRSVFECQNNHVEISHKARQVDQEDFEQFDYILAMDESNLRNLKNMRPRGAKANVMMFGEFGENGGREVVEDPYYGGREGFKKNFAQCKRLSEGFLKRVVLDGQE